MSDIDTSIEGCAHLTIDFEPRVCEAGGGYHEHWQCRDCQTEFVPASLVEDWQEEAATNGQAAAHYFIQFQRARAVLVCVGLVLGGIVLGRAAG